MGRALHKSSISVLLSKEHQSQFQSAQGSISLGGTMLGVCKEEQTGNVLKKQSLKRTFPMRL